MSAALPPVALSLIGIGTGNPDHLTREAQAAMQAADLILLPHKGEDKAELAALRRDLCDAVLTAPGPRIEGFDMPVRRSVGDDYLAQVDEWHAAITRCWQAAITRSLDEGLQPRTPGQPLQVALLVWGTRRCTTARCALPRACSRRRTACAWWRASAPCRCCAPRMRLRSTA